MRAASSKTWPVEQNLDEDHTAADTDGPKRNDAMPATDLDPDEDDFHLPPGRRPIAVSAAPFVDSPDSDAGDTLRVRSRLAIHIPPEIYADANPMVRTYPGRR